MIQMTDYARPKTLEEAYTLLNASPKNRLLGGCTFLRMTNLSIATGIDLLALPLSYIHEESGVIHIGATTSFRQLETSEVLQKAFGPVFTTALQHLIGVQLRNSITVGAHVYAKYGFSDLIPLLLALGASVTLYKAGPMTLEDYLETPVKKDILTEVQIPLQGQKAACCGMRNSFSDYSIVSIAVCRAENNWRIAIGARPQQATLAQQAMQLLNNNALTQSVAVQAAKTACETVAFGTNARGSAGYRREITQHLLQGLLLEVGTC